MYVFRKSAVGFFVLFCFGGYCAVRSSVLCSVTHNSCSLVSLNERINDVSSTRATGALRKVCVCVCVCVFCFVSSVFVLGYIFLEMDVFIV